MGAVSVDIHRGEREYNHFNLSDENVVKHLILHRSSVDVSYGTKTNPDINKAGDTFEFNQELICLYASLDNLITNINLKEREEILLRLIFDGNTIADVVNHHNFPKKTAYRIFNKIVDNIVKENYEDWSKMIKKQRKL